LLVGEEEERCTSLALGRRGQQRGNRVRGCRERESENSVATMSCIPLLAPQENRRIGCRRTTVIRLETADRHGPEGEKEPNGDAASMFGRHDRTARVSAIHPKAAGKATLTWERRRRDLP
jgi:hypothetical protein